jgi:hypothetical protein
MPFHKNNKFGFTSDEPLDKYPVCFKVKPGIKDKLKAVPNWQERQARICRSVNRWTNGKQWALLSRN